MARGRMINKTIALSNKFASLPDDTCRLLATWTLAFLDCRGVFYAESAIVRSQVMPLSDDLTNAKTGEYIKAMVHAGLIVVFEANGRKWQHWPGFSDNQVGLRASREGTDFPAPPGFCDDDNNDLPPPDDDDLHDLDGIRQSSGNLPANIPHNGKEEKGKEEKLSKDKEIGDSSESPPPTDLSSKPKPKRKSTADPRSSHASIRLVHEITGRMPHKDTYDALIRVLGETPKADLLRECWSVWRSRGYRPDNFAWVLEWYANGGPVKSGPPAQPQRQFQARSNTFARPQAMYTEEQREAARQKARARLAERTARAAIAT